MEGSPCSRGSELSLGTWGRVTQAGTNSKDSEKHLSCHPHSFLFPKQAVPQMRMLWVPFSGWLHTEEFLSVNCHGR